MSGRRTIIRNQISDEITHQGSVVASGQHAAIRTRRTSKSRIKSSTVAVYASIFVLLVVLIAIGYRTPQESGGVSNAATIPAVSTADTEAPAVVNDVVASTIAAKVATTTNLSVAPSVNSLAISTQIESELPTSDDSSISKPQIIQVSAATRNITNYAVKPGDSLASIASKFGISTQTIKWANDMVSDSVNEGDKLSILPRDGIVYTVESGDTIASIAKKYDADASLITTYNDLEISGVKSGLKIVIPDGELPTTERPGYVAPVIASTSGGSRFYSSFRSGSVGNAYAFGNCTYYVYERSIELGLRPVGSFWGNAKTWGYAASSQGYRVDNTPSYGAVLVDTAGFYGHLAIVERVNPDGSIFISEMNNYAYGGFNIISKRTISAGQASLYSYIH